MQYVSHVHGAFEARGYSLLSERRNDFVKQRVCMPLKCDVLRRRKTWMTGVRMQTALENISTSQG
jgi:hypothetical protein